MEPDARKALVDFVGLMQQDLHPDLVRYIRDVGDGLRMVHHPLIVELLVGPTSMCGHTNRLYEQALSRVRLAEGSKDWNSFVFAHARPYRGRALHRLIATGRMKLGGSKIDRDVLRENWQLVSSVWTDSENVQEMDAFWSRVWRRPLSRLSMDTKEARALADLSDVIPVWHGLERHDDTLGFSWTTSEKVGRWFAKRFARYNDRPAYIASGTVRKEHVRTYLLGRNEFEVIVFPRHVQDKKIVPLD